jgi:hypothetical protein
MLAIKIGEGELGGVWRWGGCGRRRRLPWHFDRVLSQSRPNVTRCERLDGFVRSRTGRQKRIRCARKRERVEETQHTNGGQVVWSELLGSARFCLALFLWSAL